LLTMTVWVRMLSEESAQIRATTQPIRDHPSNKLRAKMLPVLVFCRRMAMMVGRKYGTSRTKRIHDARPKKKNRNVGCMGEKLGFGIRYEEWAGFQNFAIESICRMERTLSRCSNPQFWISSNKGISDRPFSVSEYSTCWFFRSNDFLAMS